MGGRIKNNAPPSGTPLVTFYAVRWAREGGVEKKMGGRIKNNAPPYTKKCPPIFS